MYHQDPPWNISYLKWAFVFNALLPTLACFFWLLSAPLQTFHVQTTAGSISIPPRRVLVQMPITHVQPQSTRESVFFSQGAVYVFITSVIILVMALSRLGTKQPSVWRPSIFSWSSLSLHSRRPIKRDDGGEWVSKYMQRRRGKKMNECIGLFSCLFLYTSHKSTTWQMLWYCRAASIKQHNILTSYEN